MKKIIFNNNMGCSSSSDHVRDQPQLQQQEEDQHQMQGEMESLPKPHDDEQDISLNMRSSIREPILLFTQTGCPFCFTVRVAAQLLKLDVEEFEMDFDELPEWFMQMNPLGTVPTIKHGATVVVESSAIMEYMDELCVDARVSGGIRLFPQDRRLRSQVRSISAALQSDSERLIGVAYGGDSAGASFETSVKALIHGLERAESMALESGGPFVFGRTITACDIHAITILLLSPCYFGLTGNDLSKKLPWLNGDLAAVQKMLGKTGFDDMFTPEAHLRFMWRHLPIAPGSAYHKLLAHAGLMDTSTTVVDANKALAQQPLSSVHLASQGEGTMQMLQTVEIDGGASTTERAAVGGGGGFQEAAAASLTANEDSFVVCAASPTTTHTGRDLKRRFNLLRHENLGQGSHGSVYKAFDLSEGRYVAVKEAIMPVNKKKSNGEDGRGGGIQDKHMVDQQVIADVTHEFDTLLKLRHPGIVSVLALEIGSSFARIYMEWMPSGSLLSVIKNTGPLPEATAARYFASILEALAYVHEQGVVHRDIKPGNMLLAADGAVKLSDFGTAALRHAVQTDALVSVTGTINYMSPEVINGLIDPSNDMWALGASINEILTGSPPWSETRLSGVQLMYHIAKSDVEGCRRPAIAEHASVEMRSILEACMAVDPSARPTAAQLLTHPYFVGAAGSRQ